MSQRNHLLITLMISLIIRGCRPTDPLLTPGIVAPTPAISVASATVTNIPHQPETPVLPTLTNTSTPSPSPSSTPSPTPEVCPSRHVTREGQTETITISVDSGYVAYLSGWGFWHAGEREQYGGFFVTINGPYDEVHYLHNGVYCPQVLADTDQARLTKAQVEQECVASTGGCSTQKILPVANLDKFAEVWGVYTEGSPNKWTITNVTTPSLDGQSLRCSITGGDPYSNVHCYRTLPPEPDANVFTLTLSFFFTPKTPCNNQGDASTVQALEFTINKWHQGTRYELALQWENVGASAPQWRYWDPHRPEPERWVPLSPRITQCLRGDRWHTFSLAGRIVNGQVHYESFTIDTEPHSLNLTVPPVSDLGAADRLVVAVQIDGNKFETPYDMFLDQVNFIRESIPETAASVASTPATLGPTAPTATSTPVDTSCIGDEKGAVIAGTTVSASAWKSDCSYIRVLNGDTIWLTTWGLILQYDGSNLVRAWIIPREVTVTAPSNSTLFAGYKSQAGVEVSYRKSNPNGPTLALLP